MKNKILSLALSFSMVSASFCMPAHAAYDMSGSILVAGVDATNIVSTNEGLNITVSAINRGDSTSNVTVTASITNDTLNETVWTDTQNKTMGAHSVLDVVYTPELSEENGYGIMTFSVKINDGSSDIYTDSYTFASVKSPDELNYDLGYSINYDLGYKNASWTNETAEIIIDGCKKAGIGMIRTGIEWGVLETTKGQFAWPAGAKEFYKKLADNGIQIVYNLAYGNALYSTNHTDVPLATDTTYQQAYANYCKFVASELKDYVKYYEVWNEVDNTGIMNTNNASYADYAALLNVANNAIASVDENLVVVGMATTTGPYGANGYNWWNGVKNAGGFNYIDAASYHDYPTAAADDADDNFDEIAAAAKSIADNKSVWVTEIGWSAASYTDENATKWLPRVIPTFIENGDIEKIFYYSLMDRASGTTDYELSFGQIDKNAAAKESFVSVAFANSLLNGSIKDGDKNVTEVVIKEGVLGYGREVVNVSDYRFTSLKGEKIAAVWTDGDSCTKDFSFTAVEGNKLSVYDMYGNLEASYDTNTASVDVSATPKYLVYAAEEEETTPGEPYCNISIANGKVLIEGATNSEYVSIHAYKDGGNLETAEVIEQVAAKADGSFTKSITLPDDTIYIVQVSEGVTKKTLIATPRIGLSFAFFANGNQVESLSGIDKNGFDLFSSRAKVEYIETSGQILGIAAVYNGKKLLHYTSIQDVADINFENIDVSEGDSVKMFFWDSYESLTPYTDVIQVK